MGRALAERATELGPWDCSCTDWWQRLQAGRSLVPELPLHRAPAERALKIFKGLQLPDVIGTPSLGEAGAPWIFDIVSALFGAYNPATNKREISEIFLLVPKKNGKSSYAAAMMVTAICVNERPDAEFNFLAPTIEIASIAFRQARGIIRGVKALSVLFHIQDNLRRITHRRTGAFLHIVAADTDTVTGSKPLGTLIDETHVFAAKSKAADIFTEVRGALAARPDGFFVQITTQSKSPPSGLFKAELNRARDVRDGKLKLPKPLLPILYELPQTLDWEDEATWPLVNPNLGRSVDVDFLRSQLIDAKRKGQSDLALFASQHFNVEIGMSLRGDRWAGSEFWKKQTDASLTFDAILERAETVVVGIDGGGLDDLFGLAVLGRERESKNWLCWSHAWCHSGVLDRRRSIASKLQDFAAAGELTIVDDELADISEIIELIDSVQSAGLLCAVAVDPAGIGDFVDACAAIQITPENKKIVGVTQSYGLMNAIKMCERRLANGTLRHSPCALMDWAVGNIKIEPTATAIRATKQNAGDAKIDPAMAMFNAATVLWQAKPAPEFQMFILA
jgi:phage terminase large subunit-like protein